MIDWLVQIDENHIFIRPMQVQKVRYLFLDSKQNQSIG